jgi:WD40 repeat protein
MRLRTGIVRILNQSEVAIGTGFVIKESLVATCAHVIESAGSGPGKTVGIRFYDAIEKQLAYVEKDWWRPSDAEDVAILRLEQPLPAGVEPLILGSSQGIDGHSFKSFGFPQVGPYEEFPADGTIIDKIRHPDGWEMVVFRSQEISEGMSGAPVFDTATDRVVGMVDSFPRWLRAEGGRKREIASDEFGRYPFINFATPSETLQTICLELTLSDICPYRGLAAFKEADAPFFFGRQQLVNILLAHLRHSPRFLFLVGPSGSGKSSVVQAGLFPSLRQGKGPGGSEISITTFRPGANIYDALLATGFSNNGSFKSRVQSFLNSQPDYKRLFIFIDQFEELFTLCSNEAQSRFLVELLDLLESDLAVTVILSVRADFYGHFLANKAWIEWVTLGQVSVPPMGTNELREVVEEPARRVGLRFQTGLVTTIVEDAEQIEYPLPLLESALTQLWVQRKEGMLTHETYQNIGHVAGAVSQWAEDAYNGLGLTSRQIAQRIFTRLIHYGPEKKNDTRQRQLLDMLVALSDERKAVHSVIRHLANARLLVTTQEPATGAEQVEIVHDALLWIWGRLQGWRDEDRAFLLWRQQLQAGIGEWERNEHRSGNLLTRDPLNRAKQWLNIKRTDLNANEQRFIELSINYQQRQRRQLLAGGITIAGVLGVLSILSIIFLIFAGLQFNQRTTAEEREATAEAGAALSAIEQATALAFAATSNAQTSLEIDQRATAEAAQIETERENRVVFAHELATESQIVRQEYPQLSVLLAIEAIYTAFSHNESPVWEAEQALRNALSHIDGISLGTHEDHVSAVAFSPDGQWLATAIDDHTASTEVSHKHTIRLWNTQEGGSFPSILRDENLTAYVDKIAFSADSHWLLTTESGLCMDWSNTVLWELSTDHTNYIFDGCNAVFSHDSHWLATATNTEVYLWDITNISSIRNPIIFTGYVDELVALAFSPDDRWLAVGEQGDNVTLWDISELPQAKPKFTLPGHGTRVTNIEFSPDNKWLVTSGGATTGESANVYLWDVTRLTENPILLPGARDMFLWDVAISPDSHWLAIPDNNSIKVWDISSKESVNVAPRILSGVTTHVLSDEGVPVRSGLLRMSFSPDSHWLVATSQDNTARLWDLSSTYYDDQPVVLNGHELSVVDIAFSSNSRWLATASWDNTARIWEMSRLETSQGRIAGTGYLVLNSRNYSFKDISFSPDGHWLVATGGFDGPLEIWNSSNIDANPISIDTQGEAISALAFSPDSRWLVTGSSNGLISFWDASLPDWNTSAFTLVNGGEILDMVFSPDGDWLAVANSLDGTVSLWNLDTQNEETILTARGERITSLAFNSNGTLLAVGSDNDMGSTSSKATLSVVDLKTRQVIHNFTDLGTYIGDLAYSPNGQWLAAYTGFYHDWYGSVSLWKATELDAPVQSLIGTSIAFSPNGHWLALGGGGTVYEQVPTKLWDLNSNDILATNPISLTGFSSSNHIAFTPNGKWLATSHPHQIHLWPLETNELIEFACRSVGRNLTISEWQEYFPQEDYRKTCPIQQIATTINILINPLVTATPIPTKAPDSTIIPTVETALLEIADSSSFSGVAWSEDENLILTWGYDGTAKVWETNIGNALFTIAHTESILGARFINNSSQILTWSYDNTAKVWQADTGDLIFTLMHDGHVYGAIWNANQNLILTWSYDGTAKVWQANTGELLLTLTHGYTINGATWNTNESLIMTWSADGSIKIWETASGNVVHTLSHNENIMGAIWNEDESLILSWSGRVEGNSGSVRVWEANSGTLRFIFPHDFRVWRASWSPDENLILTAGRDNNVRVWDAYTGNLYVLLPHNQIVWGAVWNNNSDQVLTWSPDGTARVWEVTLGNQRFIASHDGEIMGAMWNNDESLIMTWGQDGIIKLWEANSGESWLSLTLNNEGINGVMWNSGENKILAWSGTGNLKIWVIDTLLR